MDPPSEFTSRKLCYDVGDHVWAGNDGHNSPCPVQAASFWFHLKQRKLTFIVTNYRALRFYCIDGKF